MGKPPKITIGDKSLFVCCAGCTKKVEASPEQYLTKYYTASVLVAAPFSVSMRPSEHVIFRAKRSVARTNVANFEGGQAG